MYSSFYAKKKKRTPIILEEQRGFFFFFLLRGMTDGVSGKWGTIKCVCVCVFFFFLIGTKSAVRARPTFITLARAKKAEKKGRLLGVFFFFRTYLSTVIIVARYGSLPFPLPYYFTLFFFFDCFQIARGAINSKKKKKALHEVNSIYFFSSFLSRNKRKRSCSVSCNTKREPSFFFFFLPSSRCLTLCTHTPAVFSPFL